MFKMDKGHIFFLISHYIRQKLRCDKLLLVIVLLSIKYDFNLFKDPLQFTRPMVEK
jgi:hypothetical protein